MSQERTEQRHKIEDSLRNFRVGVSKFQEPECGEWVEDLRIMDSEGWDIDADRANKVREALEIGVQAFVEIDRLNAVITDLTAKVQERDATISRMRREQGLTISQQFKEIERLRSALQHEYDEHVGHGYVTAARRVAAALKGAE